MDLKTRAEEMRSFFDRKIDTYDEVHAAFAETKKLLTDGLPEAVFQAAHGMTFREAFGKKLDSPIREGLLTFEGGVLRLTRRGMDVMNSVLVELMD